ncbi:MAG: helix-turn-helix domain-containing protein [Elusimicrobia bacterium]|nr:helix-turn-helix domain-containing protein [Elusimicrobiota bacterium]
MSLADEQALKMMRDVLSMPDPLEVVAKQAVPALGMWGGWTLDRQLWYLRKAQDLSQKELARRAGLTQARISRMEAGADFKWSTMSAVLAALGYEPMLLPVKPGYKREPRPYRQRWGDVNRPKKRGGKPLLPGYLSVKK